MSNPFAHHQRGLESPASHHFAITPSDSSDLPVIPRVLYCASAGTVMLRDAVGTNLSYGLNAGQVLPISAVRVMATGTSATVYGWY